MTNVQTSVKGSILTITVDLSQEHGTSSSGKSITVASSHGNQPINGPNQQVFRLGLNVYRAR